MSANSLILTGDCLEILKRLPAGKVQCCVTSPPYFGLRDYGTGAWEGGDPSCSHAPSDTPEQRGLASSTLGGGQKNNGHKQEGYGAVCPRCGAVRSDRQIGLEQTPEQYINRLVEVFREVRRVLRDDGTLWIVIGDSYAGSGATAGSVWEGQQGGVGSRAEWAKGKGKGIGQKRHHPPSGLKPKDLIGVPWMLAFALRADGFYLRQSLIWAKSVSFCPTYSGTCMPESCKDRATRSHEDIFMFSKNSHYFYDNEAVKEPAVMKPQRRLTQRHSARDAAMRPDRVAPYKISDVPVQANSTRNLRSVWTINPKPFKGSHFATFPTTLVTPIIQAGTSEKGACPSCGAPWHRIVERAQPPKARIETQPNAHDGGLTVEQGMERTGLSHFKHNEWQQANPPKTVGWEPSCDCPPAEPTPCVVLDPFSGAGTTGVVCKALGRSHLGIELNPEYAEMARKRIAEEE